jgi:RHS repeat-associated protein
MRLSFAKLRQRLRHLWGGLLARFEVHVVFRWWEVRELFLGTDDRPDRPGRPAPPGLERLETRWLMSNGVTEYTVPTGNSQPFSITVGPDQLLWFTEQGGQRIAKVTTSGSFTEYNLGSFHMPYDITAGPDGNLWFTDQKTGSPPTAYVGKSTTSGSITEYALPSGTSAPHGIASALGADGNLWVAENTANKIAKVTPSGTITEYTVPTANSGPNDIALGSDGALWFTEGAGNNIGRITTGGSITEYAVPTSSSSPSQITAGPDGNMWFTEASGNKIGRITPGGTITEFTVPTASSGPDGITAGPEGSLWFVENSGQKVARITTTGTITEVATLSSGSNPSDIVTGPDNLLWFTETGTNKVAKLAWIPWTTPTSIDPLQAPSLAVGADNSTAAGSLVWTGGPDPSANLPWTGVSTQIGNGGSFQAAVGPYDGNLHIADSIDPSRSGCNCGGLDDNTVGGQSFALVYNSDTINVQPVVYTQFASDPTGSVPTQIQAQLTWNNGTPQSWVTFSTTGHSAGDVYALSLQVNTAVTSTGLYPWQVEVKATLPGGDTIDRFTYGNAPIVVNSSGDAFGNGWSLATVDSLVSVTGGLIWVSGNGGTRFFQSLGSNAYLSPPNDMGTLVKNGDGTYTYTAKDQTVWNFNTSGQLVSRTDPHNLALTFTYSSGRLATIAEPDGAVATFSYDGNNLLSTIQEAGNRTVTLSHTNGELVWITNPDGTSRGFSYDLSHRITSQSDGPVTTDYSYDATTGLLKSVDWGHTSTMTFVPEAVQGLTTSPAKNASQAVAVITDALSQVTTLTLDSLGRLLQVQTPDNASQKVQLDFAGQPTVFTDALNRVTTLSYLYGTNKGDLEQRTYPDGSTEQYQYEQTFHHLTQFLDTRSDSTVYSYSGTTGDLLTMKDALNYVTTYSWSNGLLQSVTDPLGHITSYQWDSTKRQLSDTIDALGKQTNYGYDGAGNTTSVQDPLGHITTTTYDGMRRALTVTDAAGGVVTYAYNALGEVTSYTDQLGHITQYGYDQHGWQTTITAAAGTSVQQVTTMGYDLLGRLTTTTDANQHTTTSSYDPMGRVLSTTTPVGAVTTYSYDLAGQLKTVTDPLNHTTSYAYNSRGWETSVTDPLNNVSTTMYDTEGNVTGRIDPLSHRTSMSYDALNRLTVTTYALGGMETTLYDPAGNVSATVDPLGHRTTYSYDADNRLIQVQNALNGLATTVYDPAGNVQARVDELGNRTSYAYDPVNRLTQITDAAGGISTTIYDLAGNVIVRLDQLGNRTTMAYDALNRVTTIADPLGLVTTTTYDPVGNVATMVNARGFTTAYLYDAADRLIQVTDAAGGLATTVYDLAGNVIATVDQRGNRTTLGYDPDNRLISRTDPFNHTSTSVYDGAGNVIRTIDALGFTTTMGYDALNRRVSVQDPGGGIVTTVYDQASNVVNTIDQLGNTTTYLYDPLNRQTTVIDARNGTTTTLYDAVGNVTGVIDSVGNRTTFVFDSLNRQIQMTDPLNHSSTYAYDKDSRLISSTDRDGRLITYAYDADGRMLGQTWQVSGSTVNLLTFTYDNNGNQLTVANNAGTYTMTYDALDRMSTEQEPFNLTLTFTYDAASNRTLVQDSLGGVTTTVYDGANRLTSRQFGGTAQTPFRVDLTYTARDQLATVTRYSDLGGTVTVGLSQYTYDGAERLTNLQHQNATGGNLLNFTYTYDLASRVTTETLNGTTTTYSYDATNQLTNDSVVTYSYDANGNRTMTGYSTGPGNQVLNDGTWAYTYDNEGNVIKKSKGANAETWTYGYDNLNHLIWAKDSATDGGSVLTLATYTYDALGNRIEKDVWTSSPGTTTVTRYAYDGQNVFAELDGTSTLQTRYLLGDLPNQYFARITVANGASWYLPDRLGSIRDITNASGAVQDHLAYDGYGNKITESNPSYSGSIGYAGMRLDSETSFYVTANRYYDPRTGRWLEQDPSGFAVGDSNLYRYVRNDATNATDPSGLIGVFFDGCYYAQLDGSIIANMESAYRGPKQYYETKVGNLQKQVNAAFDFIVFIHAIDPHGQVDIFGWSRGGMAAIALAQKLAKEKPHIKIRFIGIIDATAPGRHETESKDFNATDSLSDKGVQLRRMGYAKPTIPQRSDRRTVGLGRALDSRVPRRPAAQDIDA